MKLTLKNKKQVKNTIHLNINDLVLDLLSLANTDEIVSLLQDEINVIKNNYHLK